MEAAHEYMHELKVVQVLPWTQLICVYMYVGVYSNETKWDWDYDHTKDKTTPYFSSAVCCEQNKKRRNTFIWLKEKSLSCSR